MLWENIVPIEKQSDDKSDQLFPLPFSKWKVIKKSYPLLSLERFSFLVLNHGPDHFIIVGKIQNSTKRKRWARIDFFVAHLIFEHRFRDKPKPILVATREREEERGKQKILKSEIRTWSCGGIAVIYETKGKCHIVV